MYIHVLVLSVVIFLLLGRRDDCKYQVCVYINFHIFKNVNCTHVNADNELLVEFIDGGFAFTSFLWSAIESKRKYTEAAAILSGKNVQ